MKQFLRILGACLFGALALFGMTAFITGDKTTYIIGSVFILVGGGLCWLCLRRSPGEKAKQRPEEQERIRQQRMDEDAAWQAHVQEDIRRQAVAPPPPQQAAPPPPQPCTAAPPPESDWKRQQRQKEERKRRAAEDGVACCPRCGSTSLSLNKKGFGGGKATAGMFLTGSLGGAVAGTFGMNKKKITCLNCGYTYKPKKRTGV